MRIKSIIIFILLLASVGLLGTYLYRSSLFNVVDVNWEFINVEHPEYFKALESELKETAKQVVGKSICDVEIYELEKNLNSLSWVDSSRVQRRFPDKLVIEIKYKNIVATIVNKNGEATPVGDDATLLKSVKMTQSPHVPVLTNGEFKTNNNLRFKIVNILSKLPREGFLSHESVADIQLDTAGEFNFSLKDAQAKVKLNSENTELKISRVNKVMNYLDQNQIKSRVIDANFSKKVVVKLRNQD